MQLIGVRQADGLAKGSTPPPRSNLQSIVPASVAFMSVLAYISFNLEAPISRIMSYFRCGSAVCAHGLVLYYRCHQL